MLLSLQNQTYLTSHVDVIIDIAYLGKGMWELKHHCVSNNTRKIRSVTLPTLQMSKL